MRKISIACLLVSAALGGYFASSVVESFSTPVTTMPAERSDRMLVQIGLGDKWEELVSKKMSDRGDWYLICDDNLYLNAGGQLKDVVTEAKSYKCDDWRVAMDDPKEDSAS